MFRWTRRGLLAAIALSALLAAPAQAADPVEIRNVSSDRYFSPNGDGREDLARVTYGLNVSATVDVTIKDEGGTTVSKVLDHAAQPESWNNNSFEWNGLTTAGQDAPEGVYTYELRAEDAGGTVVTKTGRIGVLRSVPGQLTAPAPGATLTGQVDARFAPTPGYDIDEVTFRGWAGVELSPWWLAPSPDGSYEYTVDSTRIDNGQTRFMASVRWYDGFGAFHFYEGEVPVTVRNPVRFSSITRDAAFTPNGDGSEDVTTTSVSFENEIDTDLVVRVLDVLGGTPTNTTKSVKVRR